MECQNCVEVTARLHLYIDRELNAEEVVTVQQHLNACPTCEARFHFDIRIKRLIHERCTILRAPAHLRAAVLRLAQTPHEQHGKLDPELVREIKADLE